MTLIEGAVSLVVAFLALAVVRTWDPVPQLLLFSLFGTALGLFFVVLQAPDVALSEIVVGAVAYPIVMMLAMAKVRRRER
jgi:energy-converting hydrogenase B subunit D